MINHNKTPNILAKVFKRTCGLVSTGAALAILSQAASAACTYTIDSEWSTGFTANITLKNDTGAAINNWNVNWQYSSNRMTSGWNANFSGTNPYNATNMSWNGSIAPGQSISFGLQGEKNGSTAERPTVTGAACNSATTSSVASSSSTPTTSSSSASSVASALLLQEAQAGFCRVDGTIDNNHTGFTGSGFANTNNAQGAAVVWAIDATSSGRRTLTIRYANGGTANRNGSLVINGGSNGNYTVSLPTTGAWTTWQTATIDVDLVQGNNIVQLSATTAEGLPNIDSLSVVGGTVRAGNCGSVSSSSSVQSSSSSSSTPSQTCELKAPLRWTSTGPLISPKNPGWISIKDPSIVKYNDTYHVYATYYDTAYRSMYTSFTDWNTAQQAPHISMNGSRVGNTVAPQVFYFRPHNKWYLITQWAGAYATTDDIRNPNWSAKQKLLQGEPNGALDFWVICNDTHCYLYFSRDDGVLYVSKTTLANFPNFSGYSIVMEDHRGNGNSYLFEAANVYKLDGQNRYLLMVEAYISGRAFSAPGQRPAWMAHGPLADTEANPFAGMMFCFTMASSLKVYTCY
nr:alpha-N-arabinofuranosidase (EC 3.2.1.55) - Pseudomonas fluorescens subsp. cellulosa [Cellvibrio japonicus]CAA38390.1 Arabinofuranosidase [Cellvibrio japonicus]